MKKKLLFVILITVIVLIGAISYWAENEYQKRKVSAKEVQTTLIRLSPEEGERVVTKMKEENFWFCTRTGNAEIPGFSISLKAKGKISDINCGGVNTAEVFEKFRIMCGKIYFVYIPRISDDKNQGLIYLGCK